MEKCRKATWAAIAAGSAVLLALTACQPRDRAGGNADAAVTVLNFALDDGTPYDELAIWADQVARLSQGKLRVEFKPGYWHREAQPPDDESVRTRDVKQGKVDMTAVGARVLDRFGITAFQALLAPMLVDSYDLEAKVFQAGIPKEMLASVATPDMVAVGVFPGWMRKVLGVTKPLLNPGTFQGKKVAIQDSGLSAMTFDALGASSAPIRGGAPLDGFDGLEQQLTSIVANHYDQVGKFVTGNINLWPRPLVVIMGRPVYERLSADQRRILDEANAAAAAPIIEKLRELEANSAATLCGFGVSFPQATASDLMALRAALEPVYNALRKDGRTTGWLEKIQSLKEAANAGPDTTICPDKSATSSALEGTWTRVMTDEDWTWPGVPSSVWAEAARGKWTLTFKDGVLTKVDPTGAIERFTYQIYRDRVQLRGSFSLDATFHRDGARLSFTDFSFPGCTDCGPNGDPGYGATFGGTKNPWVLMTP